LRLSETKTKKIAFLYVSLAVLLWGTTAAVAKLTLARLENIQVLLFVSFFATLGLSAAVLLQRKTSEIKKFKARDYANFALMGLIGVFLYYAFFYAALKFLPAQIASLVNHTWMVWTVVLAVPLLGEKMTPRKIAAVLLGFAGVVVIATKGNFSLLAVDSVAGVGFALAAGLCYGLYSVLGKKTRYDKFASTLFYFFFAFVLTLAVVLLFSRIPSLTPSEFLGVFYMGVFTSGLGFTFWFLALEHGDTALMSNFAFLIPFLSLVFINLLVGEAILASSIVGLVLIIAGIALQSLRQARATRAKRNSE
jgi:drug/metabolite transporter (DMT)-like permease